jgi:hypothetical protein
VAQLSLVRPTNHLVKKTLIVVGALVLGALLFAGAAVLLLSLFTNGSVSVDFANHSNTTLQNVVVFCPDLGRTGRTPAVDLQPGNGFGFSARTHRNFAIRVAFETQGRHYDIPGRVRLGFLGDYMVSFSIDDQMKLLVEAKVM